MELEFPAKPFKSHGGADVPHRKNTAQMESVVMPPPAQVILPMQQGGAPCTPLVKKGDTVLVGQKVADSDKFVSAPIHATVSGTVNSITKVMLSGGQHVDALVIDSDGKMEVSPDVKPPVINSKDDFIKAVRESGLVGLGGAGFPTHIKLNVPKDKTVDTLIINAAECEPYITADNREAIENAEAVLSGVFAVKDILGIKRAIIGVEGNKPDVIAKLEKMISDSTHKGKEEVKVLTLHASYPQGAEKVLIKSCTNREVPMGKLPADAGCIVMNVTSVAFLGDYLKTGMPLIKKRVTLDGSAIKNPQNVIVPLGTKISDVIDFIGGYKATPKKILMGGPMMGIALTSDDLPIIKQNNGILAFDEAEAHTQEPSACIRCGRCVAGCPMNLIPTMLEKYSETKRTEELNEYNIMDCMECGTCAFNCPAHRPLVQAIRLGKALVRSAGGKK